MDFKLFIHNNRDYSFITIMRLGYVHKAVDL